MKIFSYKETVKALELRARGWSWPMIAGRVSFSATTARRRVLEALEDPTSIPLQEFLNGDWQSGADLSASEKAANLNVPVEDLIRFSYFSRGRTDKILQSVESNIEVSRYLRSEASLSEVSSRLSNLIQSIEQAESWDRVEADCVSLANTAIRFAIECKPRKGGENG